MPVDDFKRVLVRGIFVVHKNNLKESTIDVPVQTKGPFGFPLSVYSVCSNCPSTVDPHVCTYNPYKGDGDNPVPLVNPVPLTRRVKIHTVGVTALANCPIFEKQCRIFF